ncbi:replication initiator [Streptomyces sp. NPDC020965]|uniref:replication initiator n=1 Tax=Streptomyces sp. NPDC020965 TaxID=3365105 RepID=UPI00378A4491
MASAPTPDHRPGPAVRDLIRLARLHDFNRVRDQVDRVAGCTGPIQLTGHSATLDATTGEALHVFTTDDEPTGRLLVPCGNRRASRCPACSRVYAADTFHLIRSGLTGGKTVPESVRDHPRVFLTLTAPSFGPVHNRPATRPCRCGEHHPAGAPALGAPLRPETYDYAGAVLWNAHASALWARFMTHLRRAVAASLGLTQRALRSHLRISFAKVAEYQRRGLVHFHAVLRLDGPEGSTAPPPPSATATVLIHAVREAADRAVLALDSPAVGERAIRWGQQLDVREITAFGRRTELTDRAVAAYVAKYATKGAEISGTVDHPLYCPTCRGRGTRGTIPCRPCGGTGEGVPLRHLATERHTRQMVRTCWELGRLPEFAGLRLWKWAHMLGFRGHFSTRSRRYSTTLTALRDTRRAWRTEQSRVRLGLTATTLVTESSWAYLGTGYTPGERLLAATVRHERTLALQFKHEGGPDA